MRYVLLDRSGRLYDKVDTYLNKKFYNREPEPIYIRFRKYSGLWCLSKTKHDKIDDILALFIPTEEGMRICLGIMLGKDWRTHEPIEVDIWKPSKMLNAIGFGTDTLESRYRR